MSIINTTHSEISICSNALLLLAHPPINSFSDVGAGAILAKNLFPNAYKTFLSASKWNFATKQQKLSQLSEVPLNTDFNYAYQMPSDVLRVNTTYPINDYSIQGNTLLSNESSLKLEYQALVNAIDIPPVAIEALQFFMASKMAYPLTNDGKKTQLYSELYAKALQKAVFVDSQNDVNLGFLDNTLVEVRGY